MWSSQCLSLMMMTTIFDIDFRNVPIVPKPRSRETLGSDIRSVLATLAEKYHDALFGSGLFDLRASKLRGSRKGGRSGFKEDASAHSF